MPFSLRPLLVCEPTRPQHRPALPCSQLPGPARALTATRGASGGLPHHSQRDLWAHIIPSTHHAGINAHIATPGSSGSLVRLPELHASAIMPARRSMHGITQSARHPGAGLVGWTMAMYAEDGHSVEVQPVGDTCAWGAEVTCSTSGAFDVAGSLSVCVIIAYFALYGFYLWRAWRQLASKLYQKYRMMNIVLRIQVRPLCHPCRTCMHVQCFGSANVRVRSWNAAFSRLV